MSNLAATHHGLRLLLTTQEVAERLGRTEESVRKLVASGAMPATKLGGRILIHVDAIARIERSALRGEPVDTDMAGPQTMTMNAGRSRR